MSVEARFRLTQAVLDTLETHYSNMTLQFWEQPFEKIDFEKRITNILYWVDLAIQEHRSLHSIDPVWVMSQIMAESLFCEFAMSASLAAGICQFMPGTATRGYDMVIAGSLPAHHKPPYRKPELADSLNRYHDLISERSRMRKATSDAVTFDLDTALEWLANGKNGKKPAAAQIERNRQLEEINQKIRQARSDYLNYVEANITELGERDIFRHTDFFVQFDERLTYKKPIYAMVHMLANALRVRQGNILSAAAAYNAGLSRTWTDEALYTRYGTLPNFNETGTYLSRIVANYEEIASRFYG
ncbi:MAG: hypothetical protein R3208_04375 [Ketobacteraceae bacterium]|nr:hypothetical protein [Ketobacteraceae bacterium]